MGKTKPKKLGEFSLLTIAISKRYPHWMVDYSWTVGQLFATRI